MGVVGCELQQFTDRLNERYILLEMIDGIWKGFCDVRFSWKRIWSLGAVGYILNKFIVVIIIVKNILSEKI